MDSKINPQRNLGKHSNGDYQKKMQEEMMKKQELEETRRIMLKEFLTPSAKERSNYNLVILTILFKCSK